MSKPPRNYAQEILNLPTKQERVEALSKVPAHLQGLVRAHVINAYNRNKK